MAGTPTAAMLVIGDEILSGRTRDANAHHLAGAMTGIGVLLVEIRVVPDEAETIAGAVNELRARVDYLFTSGGIGPTHDDITADSVAAAFGVPIGMRDDARAILEEYYRTTGRELTESRLRMARIPEGAELIENPVSHAPGFRLGNTYVMAGVPEIFRAMLESVLPGLAGGPPILSHTFQVEAPEGDVAPPLRALAGRHPGVSMGSYPYFRTKPGANLVLRSTDAGALEVAAGELRAALTEARFEFGETPPEDLTAGGETRSV